MGPFFVERRKSGLGAWVLVGLKSKWVLGSVHFRSAELLEGVWCYTRRPGDYRELSYASSVGGRGMVARRYPCITRSENIIPNLP